MGDWSIFSALPYSLFGHKMIVAVTEVITALAPVVNPINVSPTVNTGPTGKVTIPDLKFE